MSDAASVKDDGLCNNCDFIFGFNDSRFSDRVLMIELLADDLTRPEPSELHSTENGIEGDYSSCSEDCSKVLKFHISSILLAEKSPFFHKLFTNGMMESKQKCITLRIHASEETAFLELLKYMYNGILTVSTAPALFVVLKLADRFEVISCMRLCIKLLIKVPMSTEFALLYLDFTSSTSRTSEVQLLADATKQFLEDRYKDIDKVRDEIMKMPLAGMEVILSSDTLQVFSEDTIFDLVVKWIETHYPKLEDQQKIFSAHLARYIRFPYMSVDKLKEVLSCNILDDGFAYKAVVDALFFKVKTTPHRHHSTKATIEDSTSSNYYHPYMRRDYKRRPIQVLQFDFACQDLVVYFELKFEECANLKPEECIYSETFYFAGIPFRPFAKCFTEYYERRNFAVGLKQDKDVPVSLRYEFACRSKSSKTFVQEGSGDNSRNSGNHITLYETRMSTFEDGESLDSIDGYLFLEVKLRKQ